MPSTVAIIGTGNVGSALGVSLARAGHKVVYGARSPESDAARAVAQSTPGAAVTTVAEAAANAEVVILAVPVGSVGELAPQLGDLEGRIVVDATNPLRSDLSDLAVERGTSSGEQVARLLPNARVVKAFNTTGAGNLADPRYQDGPLVMFVCGDDAAAKETVCRLAQDIGFAPQDAGGLEMSRHLEAFAMLWIRLAYTGGQGTDFAFRLIRR
ncbi:MAG: NADPH-dependent F420 reductase [Solirubrobacteraceae bacterium]